MRALQYKAYGGPEVLEWAEAPEPHPGPGQLRITVRAASVNPIDWKRFSGAMSGGEPWPAPATSAPTPPAWSMRSVRGHRRLGR
jgi:NADPH:quinone reductase-like Zn-dependent oxidoreductase